MLSGAGFSISIFMQANSLTSPQMENEILVTSSNVVLRMTQTVPENLNYKVFFDNWFTSIDLVTAMDKKGILPRETVRANKLAGAKLITKTELAKKAESLQWI